MNRKIILCFLTCSIMAFMIGINAIAGEKVTVGLSLLTPKLFWSFMDEENADLFTRNKMNIETFYNLNDKIARDSQYIDGTAKHYEDNSGCLSINSLSLPIYNKFISFFGSSSTIENYLTQQGIHAKVKKILVFDVGGSRFSGEFAIPVTAYIETNVGNYFITLDEHEYTWSKDDNAYEWSNLKELLSLKDDYLFKLYKNQDYIKKFKLKDGKININGKKLNDNCYTKFSNISAYVSMRDILQNLGCKVGWDTIKKEVQLTSDNKKMYLKLKSNGTLDMIDSKNNVIKPFYPYEYDIVNGKVILYYNTMVDLVKFLYGDNVKTDISTDKLTIDFSLNQ